MLVLMALLTTVATGPLLALAQRAGKAAAQPLAADETASG
jgi:hypothetical protein